MAWRRCCQERQRRGWGGRARAAVTPPPHAQTHEKERGCGRAWGGTTRPPGHRHFTARALCAAAVHQPGPGFSVSRFLELRQDGQKEKHVHCPVQSQARPRAPTRHQPAKEEKEQQRKEPARRRCTRLSTKTVVSRGALAPRLTSGFSSKRERELAQLTLPHPPPSTHLLFEVLAHKRGVLCACACVSVHVRSSRLRLDLIFSFSLAFFFSLSYRSFKGNKAQ